jgi:hypothetical protein
MFHVLDDTHVVYTGDLSAATRYVIEHYGTCLDDAVRSGIRILYSDPLHRLAESINSAPVNRVA